MKYFLFILIALMIPMIVIGQNVEVQGYLKIVDGTQGINKVLTSDSVGLASWQPPPAPPIDITDYQSVNICCNSWMTKNLNVDKYRNGDSIPHVTDSATWVTLTTGAYCYYANDSTAYAAIYGKLYNWYAVNDSRGLAPEGWHVSTDFEWTTTADCLGGSGGAGGLMKEIGTAHWASPNSSATNLSGFTALPGGDRYEGIFYDINHHGFWWSATERDTTDARARNINYVSASLDTYIDSKLSGFSVRCLRN